MKATLYRILIPDSDKTAISALYPHGFFPGTRCISHTKTFSKLVSLVIALHLNMNVLFPDPERGKTTGTILLESTPETPINN